MTAGEITRLVEETYETFCTIDARESERASKFPAYGNMLLRIRDFATIVEAARAMKAGDPGRLMEQSSDAVRNYHERSGCRGWGSDNVLTTLGEGLVDVDGAHRVSEGPERHGDSRSPSKCPLDDLWSRQGNLSILLTIRLPPMFWDYIVPGTKAVLTILVAWDVSKCGMSDHQPIARLLGRMAFWLGFVNVRGSLDRSCGVANPSSSPSALKLVTCAKFGRAETVNSSEDQTKNLRYELVFVDLIRPMDWNAGAWIGPCRPAYQFAGGPDK
ncbi:hypothetical protein PGT21_013179 [Puccinia graminis f. sp. tritici]|uniref:DUF6589 domain-containing protein n=1 Tax=Puccinia graminis f. sp. tritici TaxID=56615 RepID=A0A5B0NY96_PUCGR|nr:hypothetical protein PGTUg99_026630 [Puccinia graminis f. sp. tritici]KAA1094201.1 hypothetical protein PGT21_013179 [Puccinia graminis f. sp. tritici]